MSSPVFNENHASCTRSISLPDVLIIHDFRTLIISQNIVRRCYQKDEIQFIHIDQEYCFKTETIHVH
jgi:hypothetical protein